MRKFKLAALAASIAVVAVGPAAAVTATTNLTVKLQIDATCAVAAPAAGLDFGTRNLLLANIDVAADLSVTCTNTTPYNLLLGAGAGAGATVTNRKMTGPASATVNYQLFRDSARTLNWGTTIGTDTYAGTGNGSAQPVTVYGRIPPAASTPAPGAYTDTVVVTVNY